ncbi:hypothetical protein RIF29_19885 [Crotalaria pallida]|uniref:Exocyst subunit Exo70 family protein n=1 Tax=Crotalaria pallida TaxID=3830 RepID=A0AAN9I849_CROPI
MEKNIEEQSGSLSHKDENNNADDAKPQQEESLHEPKENVDHANDKDEKIVEADEGGGGEENEKHKDITDIEGGEPDEKNEEEEEEAGEVPPESPPPSLQNLYEDVDRFIATLQNNDTANAISEIPDFINIFMDLVEENLTSYDTGKTKWGEDKEEDSLFLESNELVSKLLKVINETPSSSSSSAAAESEEEEEKESNARKALSILKNRVIAIEQHVMSYLEDEFLLIIEEPRNRSEPEHKKNNNSKGKHVAEPPQQPPSDSEPSSEPPVPDFPGYGEQSISNLNNIALKMISCGYEAECCHVYFISRRHAFEESLPKIGLEKISIDEVHKMQWESLEREIVQWNNTFKDCTEVYLPRERKLAEAVFAEHPKVAAELFMKVTHNVVIQILNFAEAVAMTKRAGEKLFNVLDMYETLRDFIMKLDNLFPEEDVDELKAETTSAKGRLGETAIVIFCELENSIKSDNGKTPVAGGAVHPLTRYIMNYLRLACEYKNTLEDVFKEHSKIERADSTSRPHYEAENKNENHKENDSKEKVSPFAAQLMRVMELLDSNLESKAKLYKDAALSSIFMMNNGRYIVQKIKGSTDLYEVMGETWCRKRSSNLRTYHKNYQIETWSKILGCLSPKGLNDNGKVQKPMLKERFKSFNALFEEIHKTQSTWVVSDEQLQSELRVSISALVIPAYRSFLGRFSQYLDPGRQTEKYIKFQAEDIETYIDELFDGNPHQSLARKKA